MGFGGPHAAFMATKNEYARKLPGRIVGVSKDTAGNRALRLAIQTREQHIRREKATSNICTAQVLLAVMASMYAVYHGPDGLRRIARRTHAMAAAIWAGLQRLGHEVNSEPFFDTLRIRPNGLEQSAILHSAELRGFNFRAYADGSIGISVDETTTRGDVEIILESFAGGATFRLNCDELATVALNDPRSQIENRASAYLTHPVFDTYHSETEMLRYIHRLQSRDLSLVTSMIALGSCTMKLNATSEMIPVTWPEFCNLHPLAPKEQTRGYAEMFAQLESWLAAITGLPGVSLQPNAGSQGEYAGLLAIRRYHHSRNHSNRNICLIPTSAHGTNPASAVIAGFHVVAVACDANGNVDLDDLRSKAEQNKDTLACLMITYPSTHGVFEEQVREISTIIHQHGGQVYMDGANLNAQVGLTSPAMIGADVCHLNLHKTFCIPHGGGGPGMGPIAVAEHLRDLLPGDPFDESLSTGAVSAAPFGSAGILPISWMYIRMMGAAGLKRATQAAILNANYMMAKLEPHYPVLFKGEHGRVAHEFILDCRSFEKSAGIKVEDIAKRLMDYGFHAPTMSFPVAGTLMIEPTESESKSELDRFCDALIRIRQEIRDIEDGKLSREDNPLKHAPHTAVAIVHPIHWPPPLFPRTSGLPRPLAPRPQILALRLPHRQPLWRPQSHLHLPADGGISRKEIGTTDEHRWT